MLCFTILANHKTSVVDSRKEHFDSSGLGLQYGPAVKGLKVQVSLQAYCSCKKIEFIFLPSPRAFVKDPGTISRFTIFWIKSPYRD